MLVIIGLLLGGVLKGQELLTGARVRNLISQQEGVKAAYYGFNDRFRALPGDYSQASANIANVAATANGNDNGQIRSIGGGDSINEDIAVWDHLSKAGFITGSFIYAAGPETVNSAPTNPYGRFIKVIYDNVYGTGAPIVRHTIKSGNQIPSAILGEVDRKIDDGNPVGGNFQFSTYDGGGTGGTSPTGGAAGQCYVGTTWSAETVVTNCGGASLL